MTADVLFCGIFPIASERSRADIRWLHTSLNDYIFFNERMELIGDVYRSASTVSFDKIHFTIYNRELVRIQK